MDQALRQQGFRVALEGVGSAYHTLSVLSLNRPEVVVLDDGATFDVHLVDTKASALRSPVGLCIELGVQPAAVKVTSIETLEVLMSARCGLFTVPLLPALSWPCAEISWPGLSSPSPARPFSVHRYLQIEETMDEVSWPGSADKR